jgi:DNA polymerase-3 subunit beta
MKLACTQENLQRGLNIVGRLVSKNATLPVLGNVLLKTDTGGLRLTATDLELGISCLVGGKIEEKGEITIPARLLADYVNQLPSDRVSLTLEGKELHVSCEESKAQIKGISADEFPLLPKIESIFEARLPALELQRAIQKVVFAAAHDESRPELNGVFMQFSKNSCTIAATDSFRLAEYTFSYEGAGHEAPIILPSKALQELARIIDQDDQVILKLAENQVLLTYRNVELISRLVEGQYPNYQDIIPKDLPTRSELNRNELIAAVKAAGLFSRTGAQDVKLTVDPSAKQVRVAAQASQVGGHSQALDAKISGPNDDVVFNYRYLVEGLLALDGEGITLETGGSSSPGKILSTKNPGYVYIVMPIKL